MRRPCPAFTRPTFAKVLLLLYGAILTPGKRTVTAALRVLGLDEEPNFGKYHRVLNQAPWSSMALSRTLLALLVTTFVPPGTGLVILVDETLERRAGKRIRYKSWFRDAVRCVGNKVAISLGIRWCAVPARARSLGLASLGAAVSGRSGALGEGV